MTPNTKTCQIHAHFVMGVKFLDRASLHCVRIVHILMVIVKRNFIRRN